MTRILKCFAKLNFAFYSRKIETKWYELQTTERPSIFLKCSGQLFIYTKCLLKWDHYFYYTIILI